jgi:hypothetical protein
MKRFLLATAMIGLALPAFAEKPQGTSFSQSNSEAVSVVDTASQAGAQIITNGQLPGEENTTYSQARIENAPSLGGLALGGGHPCAYSPSTAQISVIGGGAGFGAMKVDSACMLMVMGAAGDSRAYQASTYMIAARDPDACVAMRAAGMVADCVEKGSILRPAPRPASSFSASTKSDVKASNCRYDKTTNTVTVKKGVDRQACLTALGF